MMVLNEEEEIVEEEVVLEVEVQLTQGNYKSSLVIRCSLRQVPKAGLCFAPPVRSSP